MQFVYRPVQQYVVSVGHTYGIHSMYVHYVRMDQSMYVCMYVWCMYVCMYVWMDGHGWMDTHTIDVYYAGWNVVSYLATTHRIVCIMFVFSLLLFCSPWTNSLFDKDLYVWWNTGPQYLRLCLPSRVHWFTLWKWVSVHTHYILHSTCLWVGCVAILLIPLRCLTICSSVMIVDFFQDRWCTFYLSPLCLSYSPL